MNDVFVTGETGFIGKRLVFHLKKNGFKVHAWDRTFPVNLKKSSVVVHLAARVHRMNTMHESLAECVRINKDIPLEIAKAGIAEKIQKFIFISTVKVVGDKLPQKQGDPPVKESVACFPEDPYGVSKFEAEKKLASLFASQSFSKLVILRLPMVYGPGNKGNMLPLLKAASKKIPLPIKSAKAKRSLIYVDNVCDAILSVIRDQNVLARVQKYFIADKCDKSSSELYTAIFKTFHGSETQGVFSAPAFIFRASGKVGTIFENISGKKMPISESVVSRLFDSYRFDSTSFCDNYGWTAPFSLVEGIRNTVEWYKKISPL